MLTDKLYSHKGKRHEVKKGEVVELPEWTLNSFLEQGFCEECGKKAPAKETPVEENKAANPVEENKLAPAPKKAPAKKKAPVKKKPVKK